MNLRLSITTIILLVTFATGASQRTQMQEKEIVEKDNTLLENINDASVKQLAVVKNQLFEHEACRYNYVSIVAGTIMTLLVVRLWQVHSSNKKRNALAEVSALEKDKEIKLLHSTLSVEKKEGWRIGNELYNRSTSALAALKMYLNTFHLENPIGGQERVRQNILLLLEKTCSELNRSSYSLTADAALDNGLDEALTSYCNHINKRRVLIIEYDGWGESKRYKEVFELSVYRIIQELLDVIIKQSLAKKVIVQMSERKDLLAVTIEGSGYDVNNGAIVSEWPEVYTLQTRVEASDGQLELSVENGVTAFLQFETHAFERS